MGLPTYDNFSVNYIYIHVQFPVEYSERASLAHTTGKRNQNKEANTQIKYLDINRNNILGEGNVDF